MEGGSISLIVPLAFSVSASALFDQTSAQIFKFLVCFAQLPDRADRGRGPLGLIRTEKAFGGAQEMLSLMVVLSIRITA